MLKNSEECAETINTRYKIYVKHCEENGLKIVVQENVKSVRGFILACLVHDIKFTEESFRKFIQLQTKLHEGVCEKRNAATIATHDAKKLVNMLLCTVYNFII